jgi:hypothetical protein
MQNNVRMPGEWWQPKLANAKTSVTTRLDAGAGGASQADDGSWTVHVQGGLTCAKSGEGVLYGWDLSPTATFDGWQTADVMTMFTALEVTDNTGLGSSELFIVCGICDVATDMPASPAGFTGIHYDGSSAANPDVRAGIGNDIVGNDSGSQTGVMAVAGMIQSMPGQVLATVHAHSLTAISPAWKYSKRATSTGFQLTGANPEFFVALGRSQNDAGTESISFKLHVALSGRQGKWFP